MSDCYYCGTNLTNTRSSQDHIYPRHLLRQLTSAQRTRLPADFLAKNKVRVCNACNAYKGHLHPLDYLVIMKDGHRAAILAKRMIEMGEDMQEVFDTLRRRRK